jgi:hypothetical protein
MAARCGTGHRVASHAADAPPAARRRVPRPGHRPPPPRAHPGRRARPRATPDARRRQPVARAPREPLHPMPGAQPRPQPQDSQPAQAPRPTATCRTRAWRGCVRGLTPELSCEAAGPEPCCRRGMPRGFVSSNDTLGVSAAALNVRPEARRREAGRQADRARPERDRRRARDGAPGRPGIPEPERTGRDGGHLRHHPDAPRHRTEALTRRRNGRHWGGLNHQREAACAPNARVQLRTRGRELCCR